VNWDFGPIQRLGQRDFLFVLAFTLGADRLLELAGVGLSLTFGIGKLIPILDDSQ